jgi:tetratricopeptide (TPR) repeat protein
MSDAAAETSFVRGVEALARNEWPAALSLFEKAAQLRGGAADKSFLALCLAKERGQFRKAFALCAEAIEQEPANPVHYLNLGKVYLLRGERNEAIGILRKGLEFETNEQIVAELERLGVRRSPPLKFLKRGNPLNKLIGRIMSRLGLR